MWSAMHSDSVPNGFGDECNLNGTCKVAASDISLVACFGDSLLTGLCLDDGSSTNVHQHELQHSSSIKNAALQFIHRHKLGYPWLTWMIAGEQRQYNCITGGSIRSVARLVDECVHKCHPDENNADYTNKKVTHFWSHGDEFNFAQSGAGIRDLQGQIKRFIKKLDQPEYQHLKSKWKLLFVWVGGNDALRYKTEYLQREFGPLLNEALCTLQMLLPKCYIVVLTIPYFQLENGHMMGLTNQKSSTSLMSVGSRSSEDGTKSDMHMAQGLNSKLRILNETIQRVARAAMANDEQDVRIVVQSWPEHLEQPTMNGCSAFISHIDGIHPNLAAHEEFARRVWNELHGQSMESGYVVPSEEDAFV